MCILPRDRSVTASTEVIVLEPHRQAAGSVDSIPEVLTMEHMWNMMRGPDVPIPNGMTREIM